MMPQIKGLYSEDTLVVGSLGSSHRSSTVLFMVHRWAHGRFLRLLPRVLDSNMAEQLQLTPQEKAIFERRQVSIPVRSDVDGVIQISITSK